MVPLGFFFSNFYMVHSGFVIIYSKYVSFFAGTGVVASPLQTTHFVALREVNMYIWALNSSNSTIE